MDNATLELFTDPVKWAEAFLRNPRDREQPFKLKSYQREALESSRTHKNMVLRWGRRTGKCQLGSDTVILKDGSITSIEQLYSRYINNESLNILTMDDKFEQSMSDDIKMADNGVKPVFNVKTKSGKELNITDNHPLFTVNGWTELKNISVGDSILIPSKINVNPNNTIDDYKIKMLAYLLSDGTIIHTIGFTNTNMTIINEFKECSFLFGCKNVRQYDVSYYPSYISGKINPIRKFINSVGLNRENSYDKFIPDIIFTLSKTQQSLFLSRLYACDGWACCSKVENRKNDKPEIGYCSVSKKLIYGVSNLLGRFGIRHIIKLKKVKYKNTIRIAYNLTIRHKKDIQLFIDNIGIFGKNDNIKLIQNCINNQSKVVNGYFDQFPKKILEVYNIKTNRLIRKEYNPTKQKLLKCTTNETLINLCNADIYFDKIIEITNIGNHKTYMIEVPNTNTYISNGVFVHNSVILCADTLYWATAHPLAQVIEGVTQKQKPYKILIATPYETQIKMLWETYQNLIADSPLLKQQIKRIRTSDVHLIEFDNGSRIEGYTIGVSSSNQGTSLRGMCLSGDTNIKLINGTSEQLKDIKINDKIMSFNEKLNCFEEDLVSHVFDKRIKELFKITFQSGKSIKASNEHKFLTNIGWKPLLDINVGDSIKTSFTNTPKYDSDISDEYIILAANLIGDGCVTASRIKSSSITFTNTDPIMLKKHKEILKSLGFYFHVCKKKISGNRKDAWDIAVTGIKRKQPKFLEFLKKFDLAFKDNTNKTLVNIIKGTNQYQKALFLRHLFSTDGWACISKSGKYNQLEIGYSSNSYILCCDIQEILSEFGIYSAIQTKKHNKDNTRVDGHQLKIRSKKYINLFFDKIGYIFSKEKQCKKVHRLAKIGVFSDKINPIFDKVCKIESVGVQECYDITTQKNHNFIANGLVVHNSADMLFLDELDAIPKEIITQVLMPIWTTHSDCRMRVCSTPMGKRELFFDWCTRSKELGWFHSHVESWSLENDNWTSIEQAKARGIPITESSEFQVKAITPSDVYAREYGAEFGEEFGGVYKNSYIYNSLVKYNRNINLENPDIFEPGFVQKREHKYIMGVDWNSYINGGQIVITEFCTTPTIHEFFDDETNKDIRIDFTGKYRLFYRIGIKSKDATQRMTRQEIIRLLNTLKIDYVYVDYGAGDTNIEELTLYGSKNPHLHLDEKLRVIDAGAVVEHWDHIAQKKLKKRNKSLMVAFSAVALENGLVVLPKEEDKGTRLVGQMRSYVIKNITSRGEYSYEGDDHILDAFNLSMYGFQQNYGNLLANTSIQHAITMDDPRINDYPIRTQQSNVPSLRNARTIRDPERPMSFETPRRIAVPAFGQRSNFGSRNLNFRRTF